MAAQHRRLRFLDWTYRVLKFKWCSLRRSLGCAVVISVGVLLLRLVSAGLHGCSMMYENAIFPTRPYALKEWSWSILHWFGVRNLAELIRFCLPQYRDTHFFALPAKTGVLRRCAFTIDDVRGYNMTSFSRLLDVLKALRLQVMFFVIADQQIERRDVQELLRRAVAEGHEIGNHGLRDRSMFGMSAEDFRNALTTWESRIRVALPDWPLASNGTKWFRPPKGSLSPTMASVLAKDGYECALGDVWSDDTGIDDASFHTKIIQSATCDGSIIILHAPDRYWLGQTFEILEESVPLLRARGFETMPFSEMMTSGHTLNEFDGCSGSSLGAAGLLALPIAMALLALLCFIRCWRCVHAVFVEEVSWFDATVQDVELPYASNEYAPSECKDIPPARAVLSL